jgi:hypothetical protein
MALHEQLKKLLVFNELEKALFAYENFVGLKVVNQQGAQMEALDHFRAFHIVKALSQNEASLFTTERKLEVLEQQIAKLVEKLPPLVVERHALRAMIKSKSDLAAKRARERVDAAQEKLAARKRTQDAKKRKVEEDDEILAQELGEELGGSDADARDKAEDAAIAAKEMRRMFPEEESDEKDEADYIVAERKAEEAAKVAEAAKALAVEKRRAAEEKHRQEVERSQYDCFQQDNGLVFYTEKPQTSVPHRLDKDDEELATRLNLAFPCAEK